MTAPALLRPLLTRRLAPLSVLVAVEAAASTLAAVPWLRAYRVPGATWLLVVAALLPVAASTALTRWRRVPPLAAYGASLAGLVVLVAAAAGPPGAALRGLAHAAPRLLSETLPLAGGRSAMCLAVVVTWVAAAVTAELDGRALGSGAGLAVPVAAFAGAYALTSAASGSETAAGGALFAVLAAGAAARHLLLRPAAVVAGDAGPPDVQGGRRALPVAGRAALAVAGSAVLAAVLSAATPHLSPFSATPTAVQRPVPVAATTLVDPVDATTVRRDTPPGAPSVPELEVTTDRPSTGYLATAVLGGYDGGTWSFDATFLPTGGRVAPAAGPAPGLDQAVTQQYRLAAGFPTGLLPALQRPLRVTGTSVDADRPTGMLVPAAAGMPGSYTVVSAAAPTTLAGLPRADGLDPALAGPGDATLPPATSTDIADVLRSLSSATAMRPEPSVAFLQAVIGQLQRSDRRAVPTAATPVVAGTALAQVVDATTVARVATPEEFATLFAMVARDLGVPARVVTGYRIPPPTTAPGAAVPAGTYRLTNQDAWTWAEVPVAGVGWVVADATPAITSATAAPPPQPAQVTTNTVAPPHANAVPGSGRAGAHALAPAGTVPHPRPAPDRLPALIAAAAAVVVLGVAAVPLLAAVRRRGRRRRRRDRDPALRAAGAWLEVLDTLDRAGLRVEPAATTTEVAALAGGGFDDAVRRLAEEVGGRADRALCSSEPLSDAEADAAWETQARLRKAVTGHLDRRQQLRALLRVGGAPARPLAPRSLAAAGSTRADG